MNRRAVFSIAAFLATALLACILPGPCRADAAGDLAQGKALLDSRNYDEAIQLLEGVVTADAALAPEALKWIVSCYDAVRKYPQAIAAARKRVELVTPSGDRETIKDARGQLVTVLREGGSLDAAAALYRELLLDYPEKTAEYNYGLGICHKARGDYEQAIACFRITEETPNKELSNVAFLEISECTFRQAKHSEAIAMVQERLDSAVASGDAQTARDMKGRLAVYHRDKGEYDAAIPLYEGLLAQWPDNTGGYQYGLGTCYQGKHDWERAADYFRQAAANAKDPRLAWAALVEAASCLTKAGKAAEAESILQNAYADHPYYRAEIMYLHAEVLALYVHDYERAVAVWNQAIAEFPDDPRMSEAKSNIAQIYLLHLNRPGEARALLSELIAAKANRDAGDLEYWLASCDYAESNWAAARDGLQRLLETRPTTRMRAAALYRIAKCCENLGDLVGAREAYEALIVEFPNDGFARMAETSLANLAPAEGGEPK